MCARHKNCPSHFTEITSQSHSNPVKTGTNGTLTLQINDVPGHPAGKWRSLRTHSLNPSMCSLSTNITHIGGRNFLRVGWAHKVGTFRLCEGLCFRKGSPLLIYSSQYQHEAPAGATSTRGGNGLSDVPTLRSLRGTAVTQTQHFLVHTIHNCSKRGTSNAPKTATCVLSDFKETPKAVTLDQLTPLSVSTEEQLAADNTSGQGGFPHLTMLQH